MIYNQHIIDLILARLPNSTPHFLVVIGSSCSGKTTLTQDICEIANDKVSVPVGSRHFILPKQIRLGKGLHGIEPESYELQRMQEFINLLRKNQVTQLAFTGRREGHYGTNQYNYFNPEKQVIILEGLPWMYCFNSIPQENRTVITLLHNNLQSWLVRAMRRDIEERGYDLIEVKESIIKRTLYLGRIKYAIEDSTDIAILTGCNDFCQITENKNVSVVIDSYYLELLKCLDFLLN
jgi:uridine kinase